MKNKEEYKFTYKLLLNILKPLYKFWYHPTIINREVIPSGPIIICSNHMHLFDQNNACMGTNRMIHYLAKKEHLDGPFGLFFKMTGCIRVDREIHDESAKNRAVNLLKNGYAIGIFPEGTRNQLHGKKELNLKLYDNFKEEYDYKTFINILKSNEVRISELNLLNTLLEENRITKKEYLDNALNIRLFLDNLYKDNKISKEEYRSSFLLPLKYGAIKMAGITSATIVPCAVRGKYEFNSKDLNFEFGTPFKVEDINNLDYYHNKLTNEIIDLIIKNTDN